MRHDRVPDTERVDLGEDEPHRDQLLAVGQIDRTLGVVLKVGKDGGLERRNPVNPITFEEGPHLGAV